MTKTCTECAGPHYAKGLCHTCYGRERRKGLPPCSEPGCDRQSTVRGVCQRHYDEWRSSQLGTCTVEGCEKPQRVLGMCSMHYARLRKYGTLDKPEARPERNLKVKLTPNGCWEYQGVRNRGYGQANRGGKVKRAHRHVWEKANGPIPEGHQIHHRCHNRACCNPRHLKLVTPAEHRDNHWLDT